MRSALFADFLGSYAVDFSADPCVEYDEKAEQDADRGNATSDADHAAARIFGARLVYATARLASGRTGLSPPDAMGRGKARDRLPTAAGVRAVCRRADLKRWRVMLLCEREQ
jgi:hypothetical protein